MEEDDVEFWESDDYETDEEMTARWNNGLGEPNPSYCLSPRFGEPCSGLDGALDLGKGCSEARIVSVAADAIKTMMLVKRSAIHTVWLVDSLAFENRLSAINPITGVRAELATMINKHIDPGQKIAVEKEDFKKVIETNLVFSKRDLVKLRKDAPKYEDKILKRSLLIIYDEINSARDARYTEVGMLSRLLNQAERAAGQSKRNT
ncbi:hypothetical protein PR202_ga27109 [Eleusine coracana subsp. coracana]|uniref:Uncharacterized protein n=1 Tax=Eleusine coracana subsp. coracana TaxID=191504 RepID=A0AAV5DGS0_ELECO|nr:hypothetical protein PR202_ga27109 [Eleusine coracana subsp. coracana]